MLLVPVIDVLIVGTLETRASQSKGLDVVAGFRLHHVLVNVGGIGDVHGTEYFAVHRTAPQHQFPLAHPPSTGERQERKDKGAEQRQAREPQKDQLEMIAAQQCPLLSGPILTTGAIGAVAFAY